MTIKTATFTIKRNDVFDIIRALKQLVKRHDDPKQTAQFIALHLFANKDLMIDVKIERIDQKCQNKSTPNNFQKSSTP